MKHTISDLYQMQSLPLKYKIIMTQQRIRGWYDHWDGNVYVSFSGGKDSTVLVDIIEKMGYTDIPLVFVDTGLEYPEIREFVRGGWGDRVVWLRPKITFKQVIEMYGYPFISKEVADTVKGAKKGQVSRIEKLLGTYKMSDGTLSHFNKKKWSFLLDAPFEIDSYCCDVMKKQPTKRYETQSKRKPILAQLASESRKRTDAWLHTGCNAFESKRPQSNPMAFWTEQDVLLYIKQYNVPICSVYGDVVEDWGDTEMVEGQLTMSDIDGWEDQGIFDAKRPPLKTTGCQRTGCMFCGFGCYFDDDNRFEQMRETHPKQYDYIMRPTDQGGLNYKQVIDWINENGNLNIKY